MAGIITRRYELAVYMFSGLLAALGGVFIAARASTGSGTIGEGQELDAIASCVIGGASLAGGQGDVIKAFVGAMVLALISNIMNLLAVPAYPQDIIKGVIIVIAVFLQTMTSRTEKTVQETDVPGGCPPDISGKCRIPFPLFIEVPDTVQMKTCRCPGLLRAYRRRKAPAGPLLRVIPGDAAAGE